MSRLRLLLKCLSWLLSSFSRRSGAQVVILMYHRVTGDVGLELDLPFFAFEAQMRWLAESGAVLSLDHAMRRVAAGDLAGRTWYVITFDDAYDDFHAHVLPLVKSLELPVTLYVPTGFIDKPGKPPISREGREAARLKPVTWEQLEEIAASPLVTIGGHTHSHREMPSLNDAEVLAEVRRCDDALADRLGVTIRHFAYPRGVWNERVERLLAGRYETIALVGGGALLPAELDTQRLPRVPVQRSDGMRWFRARLAGRLALEEQLIRWAKRLRSRLA